MPISVDLKIGYGNACKYGIDEVLLRARRLMEFPHIICLCGSTRFLKTFQEVARKETIAGKIVLTIHCVTTAEHASEAANPDLKTMLDEIHFRKIDLADEVLILNVGGYIGDSTRREIAYAEGREKEIRYLEPKKGTELCLWQSKSKRQAKSTT